MKKRKLLYFYTADSPFVEKDIQIFSQHFEVLKFHFNLYQKKKLFLILFKQCLFLIRHLFSSKLLVSQFAGLHAYLPIGFAKVFSKKSIIVAGGTDCVSFPSIRYGNFSNPRNASITKFCFKNCSLILPVHESLVTYNYTYQDQDLPKQGIKYFIPELKTPISIVYNGYDSIYWNRAGQLKQKNSFFTVLGHVNSRFTLQLKGIDLFIEAANKFQEASFTILGGSSLNLPNKPKNLQLLSNVWGQELVHLFAKKQFYVQLSMSEGFPNALSEAMLCECVPIISNVGGMPDIVGDCGFVLKRKDREMLFKLLEEAMLDKNLPLKESCARERIASLYTLEKRKSSIELAIKKIMQA